MNRQRSVGALNRRLLHCSEAYRALLYTAEVGLSLLVERFPPEQQCESCIEGALPCNSIGSRPNRSDRSIALTCQLARQFTDGAFIPDGSE